MGEVYRARDTRLGREVAIKLIPADFAADPERLQRFEQEARATAALNHPNILSIHDVGSHEGSPYLIEELLEGETLRDRLRGGALPCRGAVEIAIEVARGLAAAHAKGILHRDLKPENIFLTASGGVKILDFGLAKLVQQDEGLDLTQRPTESAPQAMLGTAAYMSPEQARGQKVDARSDLFSLGVVLYESLSGRSPFRRATLLDSASAVLHDDPPPLAASAPQCPPALESIVRRCLEKRPEERFSSAHDLALALEASSWPQSVPTGAPPAVTRRRSGRRLALAGAAVVVVAAALVAGWFATKRSDEAAPALDPDRVVVTPFENHTGDPSLDPIGTLAANRIASLERTGTIAAAAAPVGAAGAGLVLSGEYYAEGPRLRFESRLNYLTGEAAKCPFDSATAPRDAPIEAIEAIAEQAMGAFTLRALDATLDPRLMSRIPTYAAARECVAADELFGGDYSRSVPAYLRVRELDPEFFFPQLQLLFAYNNLNDREAFERELAAAEARRGTLTASERRRLDEVTAVYEGRPEEDRNAVLAGLQLAPGSLWLQSRLGTAAYACRRFEESIAAFTAPLPWERILNSNYPQFAFQFDVVGSALHLLGRHERELEEVRRGASVYPDRLSLRGSEVRALAALGRVDEIERVIGQSLGASSRSGTPGGLMLQAALELRRHGRPAESLALARRGVSWLEDRASGAALTHEERWLLARLLYQSEEFEEARKVAARLAREDADEWRLVGLVGVLGVLAARRGDHDEAERIDRQLAAAPRTFLAGEPTCWRARIAALRGDRERAVALVRQALSEGYSDWLALHREIDFELLRGYPPFEELLVPKG